MQLKILNWFRAVELEIIEPHFNMIVISVLIYYSLLNFEYIKITVKRLLSLIEE